jgi:hypothetical protein
VGSPASDSTLNAGKNALNNSSTRASNSSSRVSSNEAAGQMFDAPREHGGALFVVGVVDAGVCVLDKHSAQRLQFIPFAHDDAWVQVRARVLVLWAVWIAGQGKSIDVRRSTQHLQSFQFARLLLHADARVQMNVRALVVGVV